MDQINEQSDSDSDDHINESHDEASQCNMIWHDVGKPKCDPISDRMLATLHIKYMPKGYCR